MNTNKLIALITILLIINSINAQISNFSSVENSIVNLGDVRNSNEDFNEFSKLKSLLKDVEIVMLGEQSHGEATAYETKIKLIKYLHQVLDFDLLVFESGFYDCHKASQFIDEGEDIRLAMGMSIFDIWSTTKDLAPLANYFEDNRNSKNPLELLGFDSQFTGKYSQQFFMNDLSSFIKEIKPAMLESSEWKHFAQSMNLLLKYDFKSIKKIDLEDDIVFVQSIIDEIRKVKTNNSIEFWEQTLISTASLFSEFSTGTYNRDKQMAENLIWIKEKYPNRKIICWGATSHFLYNSESVRMKNPIIQLLGGNHYKKELMMGDIIKKQYGESVFTIGFTAYQGEFGLFTRRKKIKVPKEKTLEHLLGQSEHNNFLFPLNDFNLDGYRSRPLGNFYMKNNIADVMDAVIFNRFMVSPKLDRNFFLKIYPENKYIKPEVAE